VNAASRLNSSAATTILLACTLAVAAVLLYARTVGFDFAYDDASIVAMHPQVTGHAWGALLTSPYHVGANVRVATGAYRPLTIASLAANHVLSGLNPWSFHLVNVLLHAAAVALVMLFAQGIGASRGAACLGALAFAVHPVHVEAVANVAGRAELLSTVLALIALVAYVRGRLVHFSVCLGAALFAKENVITIFGVVALWEALRPAAPGGDGWRLRIRSAAPPLAAAALPIAAYLTARFAVLGALGVAPGTVTPIENPVVGLSALPRAATVLAVFGRAASLIVTPVRLSPDYGYAEIVPQQSLLAPLTLVGASMLLVVAALVAWCWRRSPRTAFLLAAMLATYAIVSNAFVIIGTILGDRLLYLPSVFACLLFGTAAAAAVPYVGRNAIAAGAGMVVLALALRAASYTSVWRDDASLFEYAAQVAPQSVRALGGWAESLAERGRFREAGDVLDRAVSIAPDFIPNRLNRAAVALSTGALYAAEADARHVLAVDPQNAAALRLLAAVAERSR
jgi:protein O-mannosyl-transferase